MDLSEQLISSVLFLFSFETLSVSKKLQKNQCKDEVYRKKDESTFMGLKSGGLKCAGQNEQTNLLSQNALIEMLKKSIIFWIG